MLVVIILMLHVKELRIISSTQIYIHKLFSSYIRLAAIVLLSQITLNHSLQEESCVDVVF